MLHAPFRATPRRRALLAGLGAAAMGGSNSARADYLGFGEVPAEPAPLPPRERYLWMVNNAREEVVVAYRSGQDYSIDALARLQHAFRDLREDAPGPIPGLLLDMLSLIQERLGYTRPLRVISGYRTPQTNATLPFAAPNSLHMRGMAADIVVPGMAQADVHAHAAALSNHLGFMGIGWYGSFTHVDIGPKASWTRIL
ncbi:DUF882 domain-containing protein [Roseomonas sp. HJA6]|uniref:Murein endopeptidase K n=1 Tax=Roseomonas alba TaxID=2846776 RepID=A0ABS7A4T7_9PROT|nr:DUF882 domain-containing protein [Neoroseomonas alba]MBW6397125.1 DUF882 domain-containing protein [Neoroseomonas alba]